MTDGIKQIQIYNQHQNQINNKVNETAQKTVSKAKKVAIFLVWAGCQVSF